MLRTQPNQPKPTFEQRLAQEAHRVKERAKTLPQGKERELLSRKVRQLETASRISEWISSPGLQPPAVLLAPHRQVRRSILPSIAGTAMPLAAAPYRASGLVHLHETDIPTAVRDVRSQGQSRKHILAVSFSG